MSETPAITRDEFDALRETVAAQLRRIESLDATAAEWKDGALAERRERERLEARLADALRRLYGRKAERFDPNQVELFGPGARLEPEPSPAPEPAADEPPRRARPHGRSPWPASLPRERLVCPLDGTCTCGRCGGELKKIGEETSERIDWVPGHAVVKQAVRERFVCPSCASAGVVTSPSPGFALPRASVANGLLATVLIGKYVDHLPLTRQRRMFARAGLELDDTTLCDWVRQAAALLRPIVEHIKKVLLASGWLQADETTLKVLTGKLGKGIHTGWLRYYGNDEHCVFAYTPGRDGKAADTFLAAFSGLIQVDGYTGYNLVAERPDIVRAGCWARVRRKFFEAMRSSPTEATRAMSIIRAMYRLEAAGRVARLDGPARVAMRQAEVRPLVDDLRRWLDTVEPPPRTPLYEAVTYARKQWSTLLVFLERSELTMDNNGAERRQRPVAQGRRSWMFAGSHGGAESAATLFSLFGACQIVGIDPDRWLRDTLDALSTDRARKPWADLTPAAYALRTAATAAA